MSHPVAACAESEQAIEAYLDEHPLDHDDDVAVEHGASYFRDQSPTNVNFYSTSSG